MNDLIIEVKGLHHRLGAFTLDIPELQLERGYVFGLLGRNGAGKSVTLSALLGLIHPDAGSVNVLGMPVQSQVVDVRRQVGFVPEQAAFYEYLTATQTAALIAPFYPTWDSSLFEHYLVRLELEPAKRIRDYSKGMRVKLALALALAHRPQLLVLDEPTAGLDPVVRQAIVAEIASIVRDGQHAAVISSHITSDLEIADYIGIIDSGRLIEFDDREHLRERWRKISGVSPGAGDGVRRLFVAMRRTSEGFVGITDSYSPNWRRHAEEAGLQLDVVAQLTLDEILAYATGHGAVSDQGMEVA